MMKVIFLDIDGVLNSHSFLMTNKSALFDPDKIKILKKVVRETEAELILHSTLRDHFKSDMTPVTAPAPAPETPPFCRRISSEAYPLVA